MITADIPLAAILVPNRVYVIDPRGSGVETGGHGTYGAHEKQQFANALDGVLAKALRA